MDSFFAKPAQGAPAAARTKPTSKLTPWVEKYRPKSVDEVSSQEETVEVLRSMITSANLPHLLFYGPPGTGKTSTILALARQLYGPELMRSRVLELNASDERGINVVREKVKQFARTTLSGAAAGFPCPPYKIVILDEADSMTTDAQAALRRTMETYSKITRFCLICNYVSKIIEPLSSRCAKFRFKPVEADAMVARLGAVCAAEQVSCAPATLAALVQISGGDLRRAIMFLQTASRLHAPDEAVTVASLEEIAGTVPAALVDNAFSAASSGDYAAVERAASQLVREGHAADRVLVELQKALLESSHSPVAKAHALLEIATVDKRLVDGADEHLSLTSLLAAMSAALCAA